MEVYKGQEFREYIDEKIAGATQQRDFVSRLKAGYLDRERTRRGILVTGLRSTGKTTGILQAVQESIQGNSIFLSPTDRDEKITKSQARQILEDYEKECGGLPEIIVVDEYSWLKDDTDKTYDTLASYLAGAAAQGVKVIIAGTDSSKINSLKNTEFIHRAIEINTTYFSYEEFLRLYGLSKGYDSMKQYLTQGGIFENHVHENYASMRDYIQNAIITNLASYYPEYEEELIKAAVYTIFYECVCDCYSKDGIINVPGYRYTPNILSVEEYLEGFGINPALKIPAPVLNEISSELEKIGVVIKLNDLRIASHSRAYITNQTITAQMTKCIFELEDLTSSYLGHLYEASVVCNVYMSRVHPDGSPYKMSYLHGRKHGEDYEIDYILYDEKSAYLFECKMTDSTTLYIAETASIVKNIIPDLLGDRDLLGRYVIWQGDEHKRRVNGKDLIFTDNWNISLEDFEKHLKVLKLKGNGDGNGGSSSLSLKEQVPCKSTACPDNPANFPDTFPELENEETDSEEQIGEEQIPHEELVPSEAGGIKNCLEYDEAEQEEPDR